MPRSKPKSPGPFFVVTDEGRNPDSLFVVALVDGKLDFFAEIKPGPYQLNYATLLGSSWELYEALHLLLAHAPKDCEAYFRAVSLIKRLRLKV